MPQTIDLNTIFARLCQHLPLLTERYQVTSLGIFGSYVRHEQDTQSDLDVLVTFAELPSLLQFIKLEHYLTDILGVKVDLVLKEDLKPGIGNRILREVVSI